MDTPTAKALRAVVQDRFSVGDPVAEKMMRRAAVIAVGTFALCLAGTLTVVYVQHRKGECEDCGD